MFLTPQQIAQTRDHTLSNLLGLSAACWKPASAPRLRANQG